MVEQPPIALLLAGGLIAFLVLGNKKKKRTPSCVRDAARALAEFSAVRPREEQLSFAARLDELGYPAAAACLREQGERDCVPIMAIALEKELPRSDAVVLNGFADILEDIGDDIGATCMRDLAATTTDRGT